MTAEMGKNIGLVEVYRIASADQKEAKTFADRVTKRVRQLQGKIEDPHPDFDPIDHASKLSDLLYQPNLGAQAKAGSQAVFSELIKGYFFATDDYDSALVVLKTGLESLSGPLNTQALEAFELKLNSEFEKFKGAEGQALAFTYDLKPTEDPRVSDVELVTIGIPADIVSLTTVPNLVS